MPEGGRVEARPEELGPSWVRVIGCEHRVGVERAEVHQGMEGKGRGGVDGGDISRRPESQGWEVLGEGEEEGETTIRRGLRELG